MQGLVGGALALAVLAAAPPVLPVHPVRPVHPLVALALTCERPGGLTPELVGRLAEHGARATVFVGRAVLARAPARLAALVGAGEEVGLLLGRKDDPAAALARAEAAVGERPTFFVAEGLTAAAWRAAGRLGLVEVPGQGRPFPPRPGDLVVLSLDRCGARLAPLLDALAARGIGATTISGLLADTREHLELCLAAPGARPAAVPPLRRLLERLGPLGVRAARRLYGLRHGVRFAGRPVAGLFPEEARRLLEAEARRRARPARDATLDGHGRIVPEALGVRLDVAATLARLLSAPPRTDVAPVLVPVAPRWRAADLARLTTVLGAYRTWIHGSSGRYRNIVKGAARLDHRLILPGETFSTLAAIGRPTRRDGWHVAPVIVGGDFVEGVGGGLCQVSSTLYNAVRRAGLPIVERHHHARAVHYVPPGRDATIAWPLLDFRFRNPHPRPVVLRAYVAGGALVVRVLGDERDRPPAPSADAHPATRSLAPGAQRRAASSRLSMASSRSRRTFNPPSV